MFDVEQIVQIIGAAHTYRPSLAVRHYLTKDVPAHHSSQAFEFSYFRKGDKRTIVGHDESLCLRTDPRTGTLADHWVEPELAVVLGSNHSIAAYTLANDLTAISIEKRGRTEFFDSTDLAKFWVASGSVGPRLVPASEFCDPLEAKIRLRIFRDSRMVYDSTYSVARSLYPVGEIPRMIRDLYRQRYSDTRIPSKAIALTPSGDLPPGTVIMLGSGIIVPPKFYCLPGDSVIVSCDQIGSLSNTICVPTNCG